MILREYQKEIADKIDERFRGKSRKRFVGVKLPTGGGKSYLFMDQLDKFIDEYNGINAPKEGTISNISAIYYTPTNGIVSQTKINIVKNIVLGELIKQNYHGDIHDCVTKIGERIARTIAVKKNKNQYDMYMQRIEELYNKYNVKSDLRPEQIIEQIIEEFILATENGIDLVMQKELPRVQIVCYKNIEKIDSSKIPSDTSIITFDEGHRTRKI